MNARFLTAALGVIVVLNVFVPPGNSQTAATAEQPQIQTGHTDLKRGRLSGPVYAVSLRIKAFNPAAVKWEEATTHTTKYYDKQGYLTLELEYLDGMVVRRMEFTHTSADEWIERSAVIGTSQNSLVFREHNLVYTTKRSFKYDIDDQLQEEDVYTTGGVLTEKIEYNRDPQGRVTIVKKSTLRDPSSPTVTVRNYDAGPWETGDTEYHPYPTLVHSQSYTYDFDLLGNWIRKKASTPGQGPRETVTERIITYYSDTGGGVPIPGESPDDHLKAIPPDAVIQKAGGILTAAVIKRVAPAYPGQAILEHLSGDVTVEVTVGHDGKVIKADAIAGPAVLRDAVVKAVKKWEFKITSVGGVFVRVAGTITFHFETS